MAVISCVTLSEVKGLHMRNKLTLISATRY
jgi:hypothetical protein